MAWLFVMLINLINCNYNGVQRIKVVKGNIFKSTPSEIFYNPALNYGARLKTPALGGIFSSSVDFTIDVFNKTLSERGNILLYFNNLKF